MLGMLVGLSLQRHKHGGFYGKEICMYLLKAMVAITFWYYLHPMPRVVSSISQVIPEEPPWSTLRSSRDNPGTSGNVVGGMCEWVPS